MGLIVMLPLHRNSTIRKVKRIMDRFAEDRVGGRPTGFTQAEERTLRALSWQGIEFLDKLGAVDIEISNVQRFDGRLTYDSLWRCRKCGDRTSLDAPTSDASDGSHDDRQLICRACGADVGRWADQRDAATFLAFFELTMREEKERSTLPGSPIDDPEARIRAMVDSIIRGAGGHSNDR